jgi:hypothetical protein
MNKETKSILAPLLTGAIILICGILSIAIAAKMLGWVFNLILLCLLIYGVIWGITNLKKWARSSPLKKQETTPQEAAPKPKIADDDFDAQLKRLQERLRE